MPGQPHLFITPAWPLVAFEFTWISGLKLDRMSTEVGWLWECMGGLDEPAFSSLAFPSTSWTLPRPLGSLRCSWPSKLSLEAQVEPSSLPLRLHTHILPGVQLFLSLALCSPSCKLLEAWANSENPSRSLERCLPEHTKYKTNAYLITLINTLKNIAYSFIRYLCTFSTGCLPC